MVGSFPGGEDVRVVVRAEDESASAVLQREPEAGGDDAGAEAGEGGLD